MKRADRRQTSIIALGILLTCCPCAFALDKSLDVNQYAHTSWKISEGFSKGFIRSIAQTADGYLWLGTEFGLLRFDGVRAVPWEPPAGQHLFSSDIRSLQGARDGRLWIGTFNGLASWKDGKLTHYPELDGQIIEALLEDREGAIWVAGWALSTGKLCMVQSGNIQCHGEDGRFGSGVTSLYEDSEGNLWAGGMNGLWRWKPGPPKLYPAPGPAQRIYALTESDDGGILIARHGGITKLRNDHSEAYPLPAEFQPHRLLRDHDGGLWIGALVDEGLLRVHNGRTDRFSQPEGLSGRSVASFFEDREGSIWVATAEGLDRFRAYAIPTFSEPQGLSSGGIFSVLSARDGSLWLGLSDGLNRWNKGQITVYRYRSLDGVRAGSSVSAVTKGSGAGSKGAVREIADSGLPDKAHSLFQDGRGQLWVGTPSGIAVLKSDRFVPVASVPHGIVFSFTDDGAENIWVSHQEGLFHLFRERVVERIPWARLGRRQPASALMHDAGQGGLWLGFRDGGVAYFKDGQLRASYAGAEGLAEGWVRGFYIDRNGTLWVPTEGGLSRIKDGHIVTLTSQNGLPCNTVHWMMEDDTRSVWLYLACGLVRIGRSELDAWASKPKETIQAAVFDSSDGVSSHRFSGGYNSVVAKSPDGTLWFVRPGGVSVIDPLHLPINKVPPPVNIEQITADRQTYDPVQGRRLSAGVRDLQIDYTALSFVAPEKVRFRVKLEGWDADWKDVGTERKAFYSNLPPRNYRFRVMACNNSGVWNEAGAFLDFSIAPTIYQRTAFRVLVGAVFLALLFAAYRVRVQRVRRQERKLRGVIETIPVMTWTALPDGSVDFVNRQWLEYTGLSVEQSVSSGWQTTVHPEDLERHLEKRRSSLETGQPFENELRLRAADGKYRWFLLRAVPLRNERGKIVKWYGTSTDIEERERSRQLESELAHINRVSMLGELTASLAHEINQPIAATITNANACMRWLRRDQPDVEEAYLAAERIRQDGERTGEIVARLRSFYKKDTPRPRELVDVNEVVSEILGLLRSEANRYSIVMRTELDAGLPKVRADRVQLQQVLMNLMLNGIEAMSGTGSNGELTIGSRREDGQVLVSVSDTGVGLPADKLNQIFMSFFTTKSGGTGMGLSISRTIIESHGGQLWASNNDGRGATFQFTLPIEPRDFDDCGSTIIHC